MIANAEKIMTPAELTIAEVAMSCELRAMSDRFKLAARSSELLYF
jgi:hypothetical protein